MNVQDFMTVEVFKVTLDMTVKQAIELLTSKRVSGAPVMDAGAVVSVVREGDLLKLAAAGKLNETVQACLQSLVSAEKLVTLKRTSTFVEAYRAFLLNSVDRIVVTDGSGKLQGIVSRRNLFRALVEAEAGQVSKAESA